MATKVKLSKEKKVKYIPIYTKSDFEKDENVFNNAIKNNEEVDLTTFRRLMVSDICTNTNVLDTGCLGEIKIEDVYSALANPKIGWRVLLRASEYLMRVSPHYYRLNMLYANMGLFQWGIDLFDVKENVNAETIKKSYTTLAARFENMNLKHEFAKILRYLPYQDIYCGLVVESSSDFFIQKLDLQVCELYQVQDGLYNFKINLPAISPKQLTAYPDYVQKAYMDYCENKGQRWYLPPADKQICVKMNSQWIYPYPILIGLIRDIFDLDTYKKLKLQSARTDNYKAIMIKVPIDETTIDKPLLTPKTLLAFAHINREAMSDDIGIIHTLGADGEAVSFKDSTNTRNNVSDAIDEIYNSSGATKEYFNGSSSGTAVTFSVENDSGFIYFVYRQLERWANRYIKLRRFNKTGYKFRFYLLDTTIFNRDTVSKRYKEACTLGATVIDKWLATLDMTPSCVLGSYILHKDVFDYHNNFIPLSSSYNGNTVETTSSESGRPTNADKGKTLSEEGQKTADNEKNDR